MSVQNESRVSVEGLQEPVEIAVDRWGVPHIYASSRHDVFFAQGWNAARDRLWQIDLWRRKGLGELAEALGPAYAAQDRAARLFVYRGDMEEEWTAYGPEAKSDTEAFVAGINAFVAAARGDAALLPMEFRLAGYLPAFWKAEDVVRVRYGLTGNAAREVARAQVACKTGSVEFADLIYKISPPWEPVIPQHLDLCGIPASVLDPYVLAQKPVQLRGHQVGSAAAQEPDTYASVNPLSRGSNNWVIGPAKSQTGRPILANDPHREYGVPSMRYIAHLVAPGLDVIGAGDPALPGIYIGHNEDIAFGLTFFFAAQEDVYVYETNPENPNEYRYDGTWEPMRIVRERIALRNGGEEHAELKFTRHGPVLLEEPGQHRAYALRATWLDPGAAPYFGGMRLLQARNFEEFKAALRHWGGPPENQIYADTGGKIAWVPAGYTPGRPNSDGLLPLPGDGRYEWDGYIDQDQLPVEVDPPRGYIATANNMVLPAGYPYAERRVGFFWLDGTRYWRIRQVLDRLPKVSLEACVALQSDILNPQALRLIRMLHEAEISDPDLREAVQWIVGWDGRIAVDSPQAALYEVWCAHHLVPEVLQSVNPALPQSVCVVGELGVPDSILELLEKPDERLGPAPKRARDELVLRTLANALEELRCRLGPERASWQWGKLSTLLLEHPLAALAEEDLQRRMNVGPEPRAGDGNVVGMAAYRPQDFRTTVGASFRMVLDVGKWDDSVAINMPGQSGDPESHHYKDLLPLWRVGRYFPLLYSRAAVRRETESKILLLPQGKSF